MPIICVDLVIMAADGSILLVKRKNKPAMGQWWFPGGRVLKGETLTAAAKRKAIQELGAPVKIIKNLGADETFFSDGPFGWPTHTVNFVFLVKLAGQKQKIKLDRQSEEFAWFKKNNKAWHKYIKKFIKLSQE